MIIHAPTPSFRSFMIVIDGGYLRNEIKEKFGHDKIDFSRIKRTKKSIKLRTLILRIFGKLITTE